MVGPTLTYPKMPKKVLGYTIEVNVMQWIPMAETVVLIIGLVEMVILVNHVVVLQTVLSNGMTKMVMVMEIIPHQTPGYKMLLTRIRANGMTQIWMVLEIIQQVPLPTLVLWIGVTQVLIDLDVKMKMVMVTLIPIFHKAHTRMESLTQIVQTRNSGETPMVMVLEISQIVQMEISVPNNLATQMGMGVEDVRFQQRIMMVMVSLMMTIFVGTQRWVKLLITSVSGRVALKIKRMTMVMGSQII